ncbi:MAG: LamG domain-containing protein, partial [Bacteroidota bacterium]
AFGDFTRGDYNPWLPKNGLYTIKATPYSEDGAQGIKEETIIRYFEIINAESLDDDLVAFYAFDGNGLDFSVNENHADVNGATLTEDRFGNPDAAYEFDGVDDFLNAPHIEPLNFGTRDFAISFWFKTENESPQMILQKGFSGANLPQYWVRFNELGGDNGSAVFIVNNNSTEFNRVALSDLIINDNEWHHLIAQRKSDTLELYLDCELVGISLGEAIDIDNDGPLAIGAQNPFSAGSDPNANFFKGSLDEIKIYKRALALEEIVGHKEEALDPDLVAFYPFNGNSLDSTDNQNHAEANGATLTEDRFGNPDAAYQFDGQDDFLSAPHIDPLNFSTQDFAISFWFKTGKSSPQMILQKGLSGNDLPQYWVRFNELEGNDGSAVFTVNNNSTDFNQV